MNRFAAGVLTAVVVLAFWVVIIGGIMFIYGNCHGFCCDTVFHAIERTVFGRCW